MPAKSEYFPAATPIETSAVGVRPSISDSTAVQVVSFSLLICPIVLLDTVMSLNVKPAIASLNVNVMTLPALAVMVSVGGVVFNVKLSGAELGD